MGRLSINTFYKFVLNIKEGRSINKIINDIVNKSTIPKYNINGLTTGVLPIYHASGANNRYYPKMLKNFELIKLIKEYFNE